MGNQRRIAAQAPEPPKSEIDTWRNRNSQTQSSRYLAKPGFQTLALPSDSTLNPETFSPELTSRRRRRPSEGLASAGRQAIESASRPTVPALGGGCRLCLFDGLGRGQQDESLPLSRKERPSPTGVHSSVRASTRADHSAAGVSEGRGGQPAGCLPGHIPLTSRIARVRCRRFHGRIESESFSNSFQKKEE